MKGFLPFTFLFHSFFSTRDKIENTLKTNLFTKSRNSSTTSKVDTFVRTASVQPLISPFPYNVSPYVTLFSFIEKTDAKAKELDLSPDEADWFFVESVSVVRVDSHAAPIMGNISVNWNQRITVSRTQSEKGAYNSVLAISTDPWTKRSYYNRGMQTTIQIGGFSPVRTPGGLADQPRLTGNQFPIGSYQSGFDYQGLIVPESIRLRSTKDVEDMMMDNFPGYTFAGQVINYIVSGADEQAYKGELKGYTPYFLLSDEASRYQKQSRHNQYNGDTLPVIVEGITGSTIPAANLVAGVTNNGIMDLRNYPTMDYSWMTAYNENQDIMALFSIKGTPLMRYQYELPEISFEAPGRKRDQVALADGFRLAELESIKALTYIIGSITTVGSMVLGLFSVKGALTSLFASTASYTNSVLAKENQAKDQDRVMSSEHLDTHSSGWSSTTQTTNTYYPMSIAYPQPSLVGGTDNKMYVDETQSQVALPVNQFFKSLAAFEVYLREHKLQDVSSVDYVPFLEGYNEKWDLMSRYGFRRVEHLQPTIGRGVNGRRPAQLDKNVKRIGSQYSKTVYR